MSENSDIDGNTDSKPLTAADSTDSDALTSDDPFDELDDGQGAAIGSEDLFEEMEISPLDEEAVWEAVLEDTDEGGIESGSTAEDCTTEAEVDTVVPKGSYCKKCEFFSKPPETTCSNPGTEIIELVDVDSFRVRNCPVVERKRTETLFAEDL